MKANMDALLAANEVAPELERIPREQIVLDIELRNAIIQVLSPDYARYCA